MRSVEGKHDLTLNPWPPNGSVITNFEGRNSTIVCEIFNETDSYRIQTVWSVQNYNGNGGLQQVTDSLDPHHFLLISDEIGKEVNDYSSLILHNMSYLLDGVTIFCGTKADREMAMFTVRVYRKLQIIIM